MGFAMTEEPSRTHFDISILAVEFYYTNVIK